MTIQRIVELLEIEHECILRNIRKECDRQCNDCDLVQDDAELNEMYTDAITLLKEREPVEPVVQCNRTRLVWWLYKCSACQTLINHNDNFCRGCGRELKW